MKEFKYTITDPEGIHARPAGLLVNKAKEFSSAVTISKDGKVADAKRIFAIMGLGVKTGMEIIVQTDGEDEEAAATALEELLKKEL